MRRALTAILLCPRSTGLQCETQPQVWQWWNSITLSFNCRSWWVDSRGERPPDPGGSRPTERRNAGRSSSYTPQPPQAEPRPPGGRPHNDTKPLSSSVSPFRAGTEQLYGHYAWAHRGRRVHVLVVGAEMCGWPTPGRGYALRLW